MKIILKNKRYEISSIFQIIMCLLISYLYHPICLILTIIPVIATLRCLFLPRGNAFEITEEELIIYNYSMRSGSFFVSKTIKWTEIESWSVGCNTNRLIPALTLKIDGKKSYYHQYSGRVPNKVKVNYPVFRLKKYLKKYCNNS